MPMLGTTTTASTTATPAIGSNLVQQQPPVTVSSAAAPTVIQQGGEAVNVGRGGLSRAKMVGQELGAPPAAAGQEATTSLCLDGDPAGLAPA